MIITRPCERCNGTGEVDNPPGGDIPDITCPDCDGEAKLPFAEIEDIDTRLTDIKDRIDSIIAEQASQRTDLTAALDAIWDKVKNL